MKDRAPFELSGGQQQRAAIACVLAMQPKIMVLDEPTSFLDPVTAGGLFNTIKRLNLELKITIIIVEHRLDLLSKYADRVVVMDSGRIVADGCPKKIFASKYVESVGIGVPKIIKLHQMLQLQGFNLGDIPLSVEEFADEIRRKLTN
ncbi:MAG: ATP-binding cassette domain-containing protein [Candidatus Bathyarchaeia archaeon]